MQTAIRARTIVASAARPAAAKKAAPVAKLAAKLSMTAATVSTLVATHPAFALVDDRLAGEGTGKVLGVSGPEGWALPLVFGAVWALYYGATREIGDGPAKGGSGDDSGLSL